MIVNFINCLKQDISHSMMVVLNEGYLRWSMWSSTNFKSILDWPSTLLHSMSWSAVVNWSSYSTAAG